MNEELEFIFKLMKKYPNDTDLGLQVRLYLNRKKELQKLIELLEEKRKQNPDLEND